MATYSTIIPVLPKDRTEPYWELLNTVIDPELDVGVVDLGLIYGVDIVGECATVFMTFTSMGCPEGPAIMKNIKKAMKTYKGVKDVNVEVVWEPIWGSDMICEDVRGLLWGI